MTGSKVVSLAEAGTNSAYDRRVQYHRHCFDLRTKSLSTTEAIALELENLITLENLNRASEGQKPIAVLVGKEL